MLQTQTTPSEVIPNADPTLNIQFTGFRKRLPMLIIALSLAIIVIDGTVLNVSQKSVINDLGTDLKTIQFLFTPALGVSVLLVLATPAVAAQTAEVDDVIQVVFTDESVHNLETLEIIVYNTQPEFEVFLTEKDNKAISNKIRNVKIMEIKFVGIVTNKYQKIFYNPASGNLEVFTDQGD